LSIESRTESAVWKEMSCHKMNKEMLSSKTLFFSSSETAE